MAQCLVCGGEKKPGTTIYSVDLGDGVVVMRSVPAQICSQCGEEWIENTTARTLEKSWNMPKRHHQVGVLAFS
ncbi:MAG: type II toxin-antitoxin system MqsA family antitoxin [Chloroflexi bacterium]|nr:type II toxin-antitoxin system MqsA family antitoxin [Chloroflexota bacterium]MBM3173795.1 type II toxin-antitoxin system MqsA family antitoxin [Chloroflexota bacterium]MBM3175919.1 type II toxin-antitoxin system MqsA family antitoxin [Chloroflexota bacterium]MBM4452318.1 type II toxin-antitoxin system MqsA family antitoxin [Chloroflexota bacterium]MBM4453685.1 type II toxin-antitoxin system MqsA family antitoxin [Chloroflexota bacterium]